jgi:hypothetical protein
MNQAGEPENSRVIPSFNRTIRFKRFWLRADAVFGKPEIYEYCESKRITYFIRLKSNNSLMDPVPFGQPRIPAYLLSAPGH